MDRLKSLYDVRQDVELAAAMGVHKSTLHSWRRRNAVPYEQCMQVAQNFDVSLDWLLLGKAGGAAGGPDAAIPAEMVPVFQFMRTWSQERSQAERMWLVVQLQRAVPELAEFIKSMQKAD